MLCKDNKVNIDLKLDKYKNINMENAERPFSRSSCTTTSSSVGGTLTSTDYGKFQK